MAPVWLPARKKIRTDANFCVGVKKNLAAASRHSGTDFLVSSDSDIRARNQTTDPRRRSASVSVRTHRKQQHHHHEQRNLNGSFKAKAEIVKTNVSPFFRWMRLFPEPFFSKNWREIETEK